MAVFTYNNITKKPLEMEGVDKASGVEVIGPEQGWDNHVLRLFQIDPGGHTPRHQHDWEHINHVVNGRGRLRIGDTIHELGPKDFAVVPSNTDHQFENPYDEPFEFICIVPTRSYGGHYK
jgi:quercetin dioxygenase-like cupin family protein